jgi:hypothetical protein
MMYNNKLVASVKVGGKVLREHDDTVMLPFGSEYSLLLKNLNSRKAQVKIEIDGEDVTGGGLLISPNQTIDLERFILDGNLSEGPKFKFIEKTEKISDYRGDRIEDGIMRISYQFEAAPTYYTKSCPTTVYGGTFRSTSDWSGHAYLNNISVGGSINTTSLGDTFDGIVSEPQSDAGITTKGSSSDQKFQHGYIGALESMEHVICLQLKGQIGEHIVQAPVAVKVKFKCDVCGKGNIPSGNKFCPECGTNLTDKY